MTRAHAILSASSAHRWLECPGSARLEEQFPDSTSQYAELGTLAHYAAETELLRHLGRMPVEEYNAVCADLRSDSRVTPEFLEHVKVYVDLAKRKIAAAGPDATVMVEERLDFSHVVPEGFGTGDLVIIADRVLDIVDLKFGTGIAVAADENEQLMLYGVGAVEQFSLLYEFDTVRLTICQPRRSEEPSEWEISVTELTQWANEHVAPRAQAAFAGSDVFKPGDWCGFCRAKAQCRARAEANLALTQYEFAAPELLAENEIAEILAQADQLKRWASDIQAYALAQASVGHRFPGWKLVRGRSTRKLSDPDAAAARLVAEGFPEAVLFERSLLGITALEKVVTKKKFAELLDDLIIKPPGSPTLVPASDPRPEVEASALDGFETRFTGEPAL